METHSSATNPSRPFQFCYDLAVADPLVTIARFSGLPEALLAQGKLESMGIASFLADTDVAGAHWIANLRLQVSPQDVQVALAVLREPSPDASLEEMD